MFLVKKIAFMTKKKIQYFRFILSISLILIIALTIFIVYTPANKGTYPEVHVLILDDPEIEWDVKSLEIMRNNGLPILFTPITPDKFSSVNFSSYEVIMIPSAVKPNTILKINSTANQILDSSLLNPQSYKMISIFATQFSVIY